MPRAAVSPEAALLLTLARPDAERSAVREALGRVEDWPGCTMLAERERALGILARAVAVAGGGVVDEPVGVMLRRLAMVEAFRMEGLRRRLAQSLEALAGAGVPVVLLKGAALAATVYDGFPDRPMSDIDLLVRPEHAEPALAALAAAGWSFDAVPAVHAFYEEHHHLPPARDERDRTLRLEVHTELCSPGHPFAFGAGDAWRGAREIRVDGAAALVPDDATQALHLCIHLAWSHGLSSGAWRTLRDLARLVARGRLDWDALVARARAARAARCCYWVLRLGASLGVLDVPAAVLRALRPRLPEPLLRLLTRHFALVLFSTGPGCPSVALRRTCWRIALAPRGPAGRAVPWGRGDDFIRLVGAAAGAGSDGGSRGAAWRAYLGRLCGVAPAGRAARRAR